LREDLGAVALLLLAALGFFWRVLLTSDAWKPAGGGDLVSFLFPTYRFAAARLWAGDLPLWNRRAGSFIPRTCCCSCWRRALAMG